MRHDKTNAWLSIVVFCCLCSGVGRAENSGDGILYHNSFENSDNDKLFAFGRTPEGLNELSDCHAYLQTQSGAIDDAIDGQRAHRITMVFRGNGFSGPIFYLPRPIPVDGPLFFSGYYKIVEQDPESFHRIRFVVWGEFPNDPQPTLGRLSTVSGKNRTNLVDGTGAKPVWKGINIWTNHVQSLKYGWVFARTVDIHAAMEKRCDIKDKKGMCVFAVSVAVNGCRAGKKLTLLLDDLKFTTAMTVLPPDEKKLEESLVCFHRFGPEFDDLAETFGDSVLKETNIALCRKLAEFEKRISNLDDVEAKAGFVAAVDEMRNSYYTLKILEMAAVESSLRSNWEEAVTSHR